MMQPVVTGPLWFSAIGCGLLAGLYFAFSAFILTALSRIDQAAGIAAMLDYGASQGSSGTRTSRPSR